MKRLLSVIVVWIMLLLPSMAQVQATQTIRGQVSDVASGEPMAGVSIQVENGTTYQTMTDMAGNFVINNVPVGRHAVRATYVGYEPVLIKELLLSASKELVLSLSMRENVAELGEVVVKPRVNKQEPLNEMAQVGARMFSVEEANRYAGGLADPARTASVFAGIISGGATNGISIHGNSPRMLQWKVEGVEVYNPNHFADITEAGGGIFTSLNGTILANSDFMMGAMPAEFGNALSGVFNVNMRTGNNNKYEHAFQVGTLGIDFASEGPIGKAKEGKPRASYLVNYRYSFLEIAKKLKAINMDHESLDYQDLSFKVNVPTKKAGTFSVWFTGLIDNYDNEVADVSDWETLWDSNSSWSKQRNMATGLTHTYRFNSGGTLRSSVAYTGSYTKVTVDDYTTDLEAQPDMRGRNASWNVIISSQHQQKFSSRYTMQNGFEHQYMAFNAWLDYIKEVGGPLYRVYESEGSTGLTRLYSSHKVVLSRKLLMVAGINAMWFNLNNQVLVEPRFSMQYQTSASSSLSLAYALNSRKENIDAYFVMADGRTPNDNLGLTRSHHISASFAQRLGENAMLKVEPYWQWLFDVPVEKGTTYSIINDRSFFQDRVLVNDGAGRNYGIDLTLERYLKDGYYGMFTATLFKSEYRDAQGKWHSTRFDRGFVANLLGGKEWMVGKSKKNVLGINGRLTLMGGDRYTPVPEGTTYEEIMQRPDRSIPEDGANPFTKHQKMSVGYAFSAKYIINKQHTSHQIIVDFLSMRTYNGQTYDIHTHELKSHFTTLTFPNIAYRVEF